VVSCTLTCRCAAGQREREQADCDMPNIVTCPMRADGGMQLSALSSAFRSGKQEPLPQATNS
jgi:hypothetical protein